LRFVQPDKNQPSQPLAENILAIPNAIVFLRKFNAAVIMLLVAVVFLAPAIITTHNLTDPHIRTGGIPDAAWHWHQTLSPKYAKWADQRLASNRGLELDTDNISGTEWPLFGSVFYLLATEALQDDWETSHRTAVAPKVYAKEAINAAAELVIDPKQAGWVKKHWGERYLKHQNAFYRMLIIAALTSHARLTGEQHNLALLRDQVESLSAEIAASKNGLLEDYPGECYPGDVLMAIAMIRKADTVLGTDHSAFCAEAIRGFQGPLLDSLGLVPYAGDVRSSAAIDVARGCGNSYVTLFSPAIWPEQAKTWYTQYEQHFWQERSGMSGFREFSSTRPAPNWYMDVDSGPVVNGFGFAASAFGIGAARVNGRFDHAYPLTAELYAASWPLPDGTLALPRLLSNAADAPFLGEASILFNLTRSPAPGFILKTGGAIPTVVFIGIAVQFLLGIGLLILSLLSLRRWLRKRGEMVVSFPQVQFKVWLALLGTALVLFFFGKIMFAVILMLIAQLFPRCRRRRLPA
jgi:hypothetical protein